LPWRNRVLWQFVSHRVLRLIVPWALLVAFVAALMVPGLVYRLAFLSQAVFYLVGVAGCLPRVGARSRIASAIASFLVLNAAAWFAFWVWACGFSSRSWAKIAYAAPAPVARPGRSANL
jgi:hypothetical protein